MKALYLSINRMTYYTLLSFMIVISSHRLRFLFVKCMYTPPLRHELLSREVSQSMNDLFCLMRGSRLLPGGRNFFHSFRLLIWFILFKHPKGSLSQMSGYCYDSFTVPPAPYDPQVEPDNMHNKRGQSPFYCNFDNCFLAPV